MQVKINVRNSSSCGSAASTPSNPSGLLSPIMGTNNKSIPQKGVKGVATVPSTEIVFKDPLMVVS